MDIASLRFLVVEDHSFQRWIAGNLLEKMGAKSVFLAHDGTAALELLKDTDPAFDIVLTDLDMPDMDGMALIRSIGEMKHQASLVVVSAMSPSVIRAVETMAVDFGVRLLGAISKPLSARKLLDVISAYEPRTAAPEIAARPPISSREIAEALRDRQFEAFFQPKVRMTDRRPQGAEALVRWRHPRWGVLFPRAFLEAVEQSGQMIALTETILARALASCGEWRAAGHDITVSINLSPASFADVGLADRIIEAVRASGVPPEKVIFEITESEAPDLGRKLEALARLRMKGFGLSIDDFGTGHSSMERLSRIPFTELKIDRMFVAGLSSNASHRAMLESSLHLASRLSIPAVAEGVESHRDWETLVALGCPLAQGYHVSRPLPAGEFMDWLRMRRLACA